jgi:hypothetical protein
MAASERIAVGDWVGPPNVTRLLLGNRADDGNLDYQLNPVVCNRTVVYEYLGPTADEWIPWFLEHRGHPVIATAIKMNPDMLNAYNADEDRSPTPRAWYNASKNLIAAEKLAGGRHNVDIGIRMQRVAAAVGDAAALQTEAIFEMHEQLVPFGDIVSDPENARLPDPEQDPAANFLTVTHVGNRCEPATWRPVCRYIARMPVELQAVAIAPIAVKYPELTTTTEYLEFSQRTSGLLVADLI